MKVQILQENLINGIQSVSRMVSTKAQLPVLNNILMATDNGKLRLGATNLETGMNFWLGGKIEKEGKITVPAKIILDLVGSLPKETVEMETEGERLKVKCGEYRSVINGIAAEEFPEIPSLKNNQTSKKSAVRVNREKFSQAIDLVAMAAGEDEARPIFTGVKMEFNKNRIRMAATDGYRLSVKNLEGNKGEIGEKELVIPARALVELSRIGGQGSAEEILLAATQEERQLIMVLGEVEVVTRLLEGDFPDFDKIIPKMTGTTIEMEVEELQKAVKVAAIFARDSANIVKFKISKSGLLISANAPQVGENEIGLEGRVSGEEAEIAFNSRYLLEMLGAVKTEKLKLEITGPLNPGVFKMLGDENWLHIIMPVRVQV